VQQAPDLYRLGYRVADNEVTVPILEGSLILMLYQIVRDLLDRVEPDVVVTTYPHVQAPIGAIAAVQGKPVPLVTVVTDLVTVHRIWFNEAAHLSIVPTGEARQLALDAGLEKHKVQVVGIPVDPALAGDGRDKAALRDQLGWCTDLTTLLAVGGKRVRSLREALHVLNHSGLGLQLIALAGRDEELGRELQETEWHVPTHVYGFVEDMPTFLRASDCVLCKAGGLIVSEALAAGLPLLLVDVLPGQEVGNATYVVQHGAGERTESAVSVLETLSHWLEEGSALLKQRAQRARHLGTPRAAYEIADHLWRLAEKEQMGEATVPPQPWLLKLLRDAGIL
jgi:UDP-N-acetylglucosamine:LPS N-acetylglucosamine transferase